MTYRGDYYYSYSHEYTGAVNIPSTVTYNGVTYSVTSIGDRAFSGCSGLTSVTIPNSVTSIGDRAFSGCSGLTSMVVESGNTRYDSRNNCNAIMETATNTLISGCKNTIIPNSVTSIGSSAFRDCSGLTSVTIPNSVTSIGNMAFYGCSGLTSVTIPNSVTSIGSSAFNGCSGLTSVTIPNSVTSIGSLAFNGCTGLTSMVVESGNTRYDSRNNCNAIMETATNTLISGCKNTIIPNSVTTIGSSAFSGCSGLTSVTIPNSVTLIGWAAFHGCSGLTSVTIPNSVTSIGSSAFSGCSGLTSMVVESGNTRYDSRNNCNAIIETATNTLISGCKNTIIPNSVTSIGKDAFYCCSGLTSVTIANSVTSIGDFAFQSCTGLTSVTIGNSVTSIGISAFSGCSGLTSVTWNAKNYSNFSSSSYTPFNGLTGITSFVFGNEVEHIPAYLCYGLTGLTSVSIPNSVTSIGRNALSGTSWYNNQSDGLVYAGMVAYKYKGTMPDGTSIALIDGCKGVADEAFYECSGLTSVTIPNSVTSIGSSSFNGCTNLRSIYCKILVPENVSYGTSIFNGVSINYCKLYVPVGTLDSYQFTAPWNDFLNIIEYDYGPEFIMGDANGDGTIDVADYVDVASYILEQDPQPFNFAAADLDEDNTIDVGDLVGVAYLALNYEGAPMLAAAVGSPEAASISMDATVNNTAGGQYEVALNLNNNVALTAIQMDINLPQGMTLVDASLTDRASASHQIAFNLLSNGDYRLLASSSALKCFKNNDGAVLTLTLSGTPDGNGCLRCIKLAAPSSTRFCVDDIELNFSPTGVDNVTTEARIYNEGNNIVIISPIDGTAQIVLPNGMNRPVKVATGRNVFETPVKGLVIVKMGNMVEKLQF